MTQKNTQASKKTKPTKARIEKDFIANHPVGSKVEGMTIFDVARSQTGEIYIIVPLYEFIKSIEKKKTDPQVK